MKDLNSNSNTGRGKILIFFVPFLYINNRVSSASLFSYDKINVTHRNSVRNHYVSGKTQLKCDINNANPNASIHSIFQIGKYIYTHTHTWCAYICKNISMAINSIT